MCSLNPGEPTGENKCKEPFSLLGQLLGMPATNESNEISRDNTDGWPLDNVTREASICPTLGGEDAKRIDDSDPKGLDRMSYSPEIV